MARIYVDAWDPSYGSAWDPGDSGVAGGPIDESTAQLGADVELPAASWRPLSPPSDLRPPGVVLLVDGVRRIDARVWVEESDATLHPGLAASYAAGVVRCDLRRGTADVISSRVARGLFTPSPSVSELIAASTSYPVRRVAAGDPVQLAAAIQPHLHALEEEVSRGAREPEPCEDDLLVVDGPLRGRTQLPRALGYVKTHRVSYLPSELSGVVGQLRAGQRSPVFLLGTSWHRYTWYVKLPGPAGSPWAGVVRVEACADLTRTQAIAMADRSALTLPRFASTPYKDPRAPQNLIPIGGLERRLRGMLGDQRLLVRSLMSTAGAFGRGPAQPARNDVA